MSNPQTDTGFATPGADLLRAAYAGDLGLVRTALEGGVSIEASDERTGLTALHIAVGTNNFALTRFLVEEWNAPFGPDKYGRWPTLIAAESCVDDELADYIVTKEAGFLGRSAP